MSSVTVARGLDELGRISPRSSAVTLGVFDGVHRGHQRIIDEVIALRGKPNIGGIFLITFDPHPVVVTQSRRTPPILTTIDERLELLSRFDLDGVFVLDFDDSTARIHYRDFIDRYLLGAFDMKHLVLGYDCHFGHRREGSPERVQAEGPGLGFDVTVVPAVENSDGVISSTHIRETLIAGDVFEANRLLGHPYLVAGRVVRGQGRGKSLGYPTANLGIDNPHKLWPPRGVYAVTAKLGKSVHRGMMNVGTAPTIKDDAALMEVHLFDFDRDIYGETLYVECVRYLREERAFPSVGALVAQLAKDRDAALAALEDGA